MVFLSKFLITILDPVAALGKSRRNNHPRKEQERERCLVREHGAREAGWYEKPKMVI